MKYRLGLDLGVGSIGSAVVELNEDNSVKDIIDAGVRIFEVSEGAIERREKRSARKNLVRTQKRLELLAEILFKNGLWANRDPKGTNKLRAISPYTIRRDALYKNLENPYYIGRAILHLAKHRGAGFVSAAEETQEEITEEENTKKKKETPYEKMVSYLRETDSKTIGEYFYKRLEAGYAKNDGTDKNTPFDLKYKNPTMRYIRQSTHAQDKKIVDYAIPRYLVKDEFNQIWDNQAQYFPQMQKEGLKQRVYDILFYERPPAPYATGKCIYYENEERLLKAHPLAEERRIYEEVNNVRIESLLDRRKLTKAERDLIINELLLKGKNAGKKAIKDILKLGAHNKVSLDEDRIIKAYLYSTPDFSDIDYIRNLSQEELWKFAEFLGNPENPNDASGRLYNEDDVITKLKEIFGIDDEKRIGHLLTKLPKGRGNLGKTATIKILEKLKSDVISHREATDKLAKEDSHFIAEEEKIRAEQGSCNQLPYYGKVLVNDTQALPPLMIRNNASHLNPDEVKYGKIANPAVHMILNQIRLVVNDIIRIYGKPYDINVELGRDVGMSAKKLKEHENIQRNNEKINEEAIKYLKDRHIYINRENIRKYRLAEEQGWADAYNPSQEIPQNFQGFEVEHIIPRSKGGSDSLSNLCLVFRTENEAKGNMFAYEYFEKNKSQAEIENILKFARDKLPKKAWRFEPDAREYYEENGDEEETNRYLTDTRYVSKLAARYLRYIVDCADSEDIMENRILPVKGAQTATLRKVWNLQGLEYDLMGLNNEVPRYIPEEKPYWYNSEGVVSEFEPDEKGWTKVDRKKNPEWMSKPRIDHRHHAMDAITIACTNRGLIKNMSNELDIHNKSTRYPLPMESVQSTADFRRRVIEVLREVKVSHKPEHSKNGELHKETGRKILCQNPKDKNAVITVYTRKILDVVKTFKDLNKLLVSSTVKDEWYPTIAEDRAKQAKLVEDIKLYADSAEQILIAENEKYVEEGKKEIKITETRILIRAFKFIQEKGLYTKGTFNCYESNSSLVIIPKHGLAYEGRNNHCVDFYVKDGKIGWEVIRRFDINQADFIPQWKQNGGKLIWSVQQGDMLELDTPEEWQGYTDNSRCLAKVKKFSSGKIAIDYMTDARMTSPKDKGLQYMYIDTISDKGLSYIIKHHARKIELTPFGKVKRKHKVLSDGTAETR